MTTNVLLYSSTLAVVLAAMIVPLGLYVAFVNLFNLDDSDLLLSVFIGASFLAGFVLLRRKPFR